jgi:hypothetical protein
MCISPRSNEHWILSHSAPPPPAGGCVAGPGPGVGAGVGPLQGVKSVVISSIRTNNSITMYIHAQH